MAIAVMTAAAGAPARAGTAKPQATAAAKVKRTGWRKLVPRAPARVRRVMAQTSVRGSVGVRKGMVGVGGMGVDLEVVKRSAEEAKADGARKWAGVLSVGPSTAIGTARVHASHDRKLIPKVATWSYSIGPRSKRSPTQGDGIGVPTLNPFIGVTVSRKGGFGIKVAGWPTPFGPWPFVYGTANIGVNHPGLEKASAVVLDRADRFERWMGRVTAPVRRPIAAAATRLVIGPAKRAIAATGRRLAKPRPTRGSSRPHMNGKRVTADRRKVIGEGATRIVYEARDGKHVVVKLKPGTRRERIELAHRTVAGMDALRDAGLPIPAAWIERGSPDAIVQEKVTAGLKLSDLHGLARLRARAGLLGLDVRTARELWPRRAFGWTGASPSDVRFDAHGNVVSWFGPVAPRLRRAAPGATAGTSSASRR